MPFKDSSTILQDPLTTLANAVQMRYVYTRKVYRGQTRTMTVSPDSLHGRCAVRLLDKFSARATSVHNFGASAAEKVLWRKKPVAVYKVSGMFFSSSLATSVALHDPGLAIFSLGVSLAGSEPDVALGLAILPALTLRRTSYTLAGRR